MAKARWRARHGAWRMEQAAGDERIGSIQAADGVRLGYRLRRGTGRRPLLVLIHGLASNLTRWSEFVEHTALARDWDLLRVDLRGHASSMCRGRIGRRQWVDDLRQVLDAEGYERAVIAGHSLGAQVAIEFADHHPQRCAGLVLIDPTFPQALHGVLATAQRLRPLLWLAVRLIWLFNALGLRRRELPPRDLRALDERTREALAAGANIAELYMSPRADLRHLPLANYLQDLCEVTRPLPALDGIAAPTLVLLSKGAAVSSRAETERIIAALPDSHTVVIDADHWLLTERPREAREAIEHWCRERA